MYFFSYFYVQNGAPDKFTANFWLGSKFKWTNNDLDYVGGQGCTISIDPDVISWFDLDDYFGKDFLNLEMGKIQFEFGRKAKFSIFNLFFWGFKLHQWREEQSGRRRRI